MARWLDFCKFVLVLHFFPYIFGFPSFYINSWTSRGSSNFLFPKFGSDTLVAKPLRKGPPYGVVFDQSSEANDQNLTAHSLKDSDHAALISDFRTEQLNKAKVAILDQNFETASERMTNLSIFLIGINVLPNFEEVSLLVRGYFEAAHGLSPVWIHLKHHEDISNAYQKGIYGKLREQIHSQLARLCDDGLNIADRLFQTSRATENRLLLLIMKAELKRQLARVCLDGETRRFLIIDAEEAYNNGWNLAQRLSAGHEIRLSFAISKANFVEEEMRDINKSCLIAKMALEEANKSDPAALDEFGDKWEIALKARLCLHQKKCESNVDCTVYTE